MNERIQSLKDLTFLDDATFLKPIADKILNQGIPLVPFPYIQKCLGLSSKDSSMMILDGYAILAYDF